MPISEGRILFISDTFLRDEESNAELNQSSMMVERVEGVEDLFERIALKLPDAVIIAICFANSSSLALIKNVSRYRIPVVVLLDEDNEQYALEAIRAGAQECLPRTRAARGQSLSRVLHTAIERQKAQSTGVAEHPQAKEAEQRHRQLAEALQKTAVVLAESLDPDVIMNRALENVGVVVPHDASTIVLPEGSNWRLAYMHGRHAANAIKPFEEVPFTQEIRTFTRMYETGEPLLVPDTDQYPFWVRFAESGWIRSYLGAPIRIEGEIIGFLNLDSATPGAFTEEHAEALRVYVDQVAVALKNAQLYQKLHQTAQELAMLYRATAFLYTPLAGFSALSEIAEQVVQAIVQEFDAVDCSVIFENGLGELRRLARGGDYQVQTNRTLQVNGPGLIPACYRSSEMIYAPEVSTDPHYVMGDARTRSELVMPLRTAHGLIGVLDLQSMALNAFRQQDIQVIAAFAERAAIVLENAQLYQQVLRHNDELEQRIQERTQALEQERLKFNVILDSLDEAVVFWKSTFPPIIHYINPAFCEMVGYSATELLSSPNGILEVIRPIPDLNRYVGEMLKTIWQQGKWRGNLPLQRKDGSLLDVDVKVTAVERFEDGRMNCVGLLRDISQEKRLQQQKDRFIANASHELRTPLTNLRMQLYLLAKRPEHMDEHMAVIQKLSARMHELVEALLDVSRFERNTVKLERAAVVIQNLIVDVIETQRPHAERKSIHLWAILPPEDVVNYVDEERLAQVLTNLVVNAINYTPDAGKIWVELDTGYANNPNATVIRVHDTGIGIDDDSLPFIFDPFFRAHGVTEQGTGLGLTITKEIVELHGGQILVDSIQNVGTVFTVILPGFTPNDAYSVS